MSMTMRFRVGEKVRAHLTTIGLEKGRTYTVTGVEVEATAFGMFAHYRLDDAFWVPNGHLLLARAETVA
jgi:hypothetical protein